jgi:hypothetical protein
MSQRTTTGCAAGLGTCLSVEGGGTVGSKKFSGHLDSAGPMNHLNIARARKISSNQSSIYSVNIIPTTKMHLSEGKYTAMLGRSNRSNSHANISKFFALHYWDVKTSLMISNYCKAL